MTNLEILRRKAADPIAAANAAGADPLLQRAHRFAATRYLRQIHRAGLGLQMSVDPEAEKARESARAFASVVLAGFGEPPLPH